MSTKIVWKIETKYSGISFIHTIKSGTVLACQA